MAGHPCAQTLWGDPHSLLSPVSYKCYYNANFAVQDIVFIILLNQPLSDHKEQYRHIPVSKLHTKKMSFSLLKLHLCFQGTPSLSKMSPLHFYCSTETLLSWRLWGEIVSLTLLFRTAHNTLTPKKCKHVLVFCLPHICHIPALKCHHWKHEKRHAQHPSIEKTNLKVISEGSTVVIKKPPCDEEEDEVG